MEKILDILAGIRHRGSVGHPCIAPNSDEFPPSTQLKAGSGRGFDQEVSYWIEQFPDCRTSLKRIDAVVFIMDFPAAYEQNPAREAQGKPFFDSGRKYCKNNQLF